VRHICIFTKVKMCCNGHGASDELSNHALCMPHCFAPGLPNVVGHDDIPKAVNQKDGTCISPANSTQTGFAPWAATKYYDTRGVDFEDLQPIPGEAPEWCCCCFCFPGKTVLMCKTAPQS
jgi:hypothetical protein